MQTVVFRPTVNYFTTIVYSDKNLDQQTKLIRNQACSLDLGNPHFNLITYVGSDKDSRTRYLEWVADWKVQYKRLSETIRALKQQRTFAGTSKVHDELVKANPDKGNFAPGEFHSWNQERVRKTLVELKRAAQIALNAGAAVGIVTGKQIYA